MPPPPKTHLMYRIFRFANAALRADIPLRSALSAPLTQTLARLAALDRPLSFALPLTGDAMAPLLSASDTLVIRAMAAAPATVFNALHVDDVVVIKDPADERRKYVRRIAAVEGGEMVGGDGEDGFRIPRECVWVVRDNLGVKGVDSTVFGPLGLGYVVGRVMYSIRSAVDHGRVMGSVEGMQADDVVLRQEKVGKFIDEHGRREREESESESGGAAEEK